MNNYDVRAVRDIFSRIFVLGIKYKFNFESFTFSLSKSRFIEYIEKERYIEIVNIDIKNIFYSIYSYSINEDTSYGVYNDAYWVGQSYFDLHLKTKKSFAYIFLKLSLRKMMDMYPVYHEMDFTSLYSYFLELEKKETILALLCKDKGCSLIDVSKKTLISSNTLKLFRKSDAALYKSSFQNIVKLSNYFDVPLSLFIE